MSKLLLSLFAAIVAIGLSAAPTITYAETDEAATEDAATEDAATEEAADEADDSGEAEEDAGEAEGE